jgi:hypothetical protein
MLAFDIAGEAALLVGGRGDGVQAVADLRPPNHWSPAECGHRGNRRLAAFQMLQASLDARRTATDWALRLAVMASISLAEREDFRPACALRRRRRQSRALLAGPGRLDGGIEGQQVGLFGDVLDFARHQRDRFGVAHELLTESAISLTRVRRRHFAEQHVQVAAAFRGPARLSCDWCWTCSALWAIDEMLETSCSTAVAAWFDFSFCWCELCVTRSALSESAQRGRKPGWRRRAPGGRAG